MAMDLETLDHVGLSVADVPQSVRWYQDVLGLRRAHQDAWGDFPAVLEAGGSGVALFPRHADDPEPSPGPDAACRVPHVAGRPGEG
jgi:catechol 2,3-dioxygenase-like lactoylglutathione lyase family enzyme